MTENNSQYKAQCLICKTRSDQSSIPDDLLFSVFHGDKEITPKIYQEVQRFATHILTRNQK